MDINRHIKTIEIFNLTDPCEAPEMTFPAFIQWLAAKVPNEFLDSVRVRATREYGECESYTMIIADYKRPETDQEMLARIKYDNGIVIDAEEERELREFIRLKAKYG